MLDFSNFSKLLNINKQNIKNLKLNNNFFAKFICCIHKKETLNCNEGKYNNKIHAISVAENIKSTIQ